MESFKKTGGNNPPIPEQTILLRRCLLCRRKWKLERNNNSPPNGPPPPPPVYQHQQGQGTKACSKLGFQMLLRYLGIGNIGGIPNVSPTPSSSSSSPHVKKDAELESSLLCAQCSAEIDNFWEVYKQFETVRLELTRCLDKLKQYLEGTAAAAGESRREEEDGSNLHVNEDGLKEQVLTKCATRLTRVPKVMLDKIEMNDYGNVEVVIKQEPMWMEPNPDFGGDFHDPGEANQEEEEDVKPSVSSIPDDEMNKPVIIRVHGGENANNESKMNPSNQPIQKQNPINPLKSSTRLIKIPCRECGKLVSQRGLGLHMTSKHRQTKLNQKRRCRYCSKVSGDARHHQRHVLFAHPIQFLSSDLPIGTTKEALDAVLGQLYKECEVVAFESGNISTRRCFICKSVFMPGFQWRVHALETHLDTIVSLLENEKHPVKVAPPRPPPSSVVIQHQNPPSSPPPSPPPAQIPNRANDSSECGGGVTCPVCGKVHADLRSQRPHLRNSHPFVFFKKRLTENATEQEVESAVQRAYKAIVLKHVEDEPRYKCPFCSGLFNSKANCKSHFLAVHSKAVLGAALLKKEAPPIGIQCTHCPKVCKDRHTHRFHILSKHVYEFVYPKIKHIPIPPYTLKRDLQQTLIMLADQGKLKVPQNNKNYKCPLCPTPVLFLRKAEVERHLCSELHLDTLISKLPCNIKNPPPPPPTPDPNDPRTNSTIIAPNLKEISMSVLHGESRVEPETISTPFPPGPLPPNVVIKLEDEADSPFTEETEEEDMDTEVGGERDLLRNPDPLGNLEGEIPPPSPPLPPAVQQWLKPQPSSSSSTTTSSTSTSVTGAHAHHQCKRCGVQFPTFFKLRSHFNHTHR